MVHCAAEGCQNTSKLGVKMNKLPKEIDRQEKWIQNAKLENKRTKRYIALCEFHFTSNMWEQTRSDGKKKLKCTAIPTIFGELVTQKVITREAGINRNVVNLNKIEEQSTILTTTESDGTVTIKNLEEQCQSVSIDIEQRKNTQIIKKTESNQNTINLNRIEGHSLATSIEHNDSVTVLRKTPECQLDDLSSDIKEQTAQLSSDGKQKDISNSIHESNLDKQNLLYVEKINKLEKLLQRSESLRIIMKKRHKGLQNKYKKRIKDLEKKVSLLFENVSFGN